jgi:hypothetical protein
MGTERMIRCTRCSKLAPTGGLKVCSECLRSSRKKAIYVPGELYDEARANARKRKITVDEYATDIVLKGLR